MARVNPSSDDSDRWLEHYLELLAVAGEKNREQEEKTKVEAINEDAGAINEDAGRLKNLFRDRFTPAHLNTLMRQKKSSACSKLHEPQNEVLEEQYCEVRASVKEEKEEVLPRFPIPIFSYSMDGFQLYGLPHPKLGEIVGLIGPKLSGKTTALEVLAGKLKPNLCNPEDPPSWEEVLLRLDEMKEQPGVELIRDYLARIKENDLKVSYKPQTVSPKDLKEVQKDNPPSALEPLLIRSTISRLNKENPYCILDMCDILKLEYGTLTSEEAYLTDADRQKVLIAIALLAKADSYILDEPCKYLSPRQRLDVAKAVKSVVKPDRYFFWSTMTLILSDTWPPLPLLWKAPLKREYYCNPVSREMWKGHVRYIMKRIESERNVIFLIV